MWKHIHTRSVSSIDHCWTRRSMSVIHSHLMRWKMEWLLLHWTFPVQSHVRTPVLSLFTFVVLACLLSVITFMILYMIVSYINNYEIYICNHIIITYTITQDTFRIMLRSWVQPHEWTFCELKRVHYIGSRNGSGRVSGEQKTPRMWVCQIMKISDAVWQN